MPLYHLLLAAWVSIWGDSERALREFNLPFALLFIASIMVLCVRSSRHSRYWVTILFSVFPLLIYYVNDARPYIALLGLSTAATVAFLSFVDRPSRSAAWCCFLFSVCTVAMHLFGALCPLSLLIFICIRRDARRQLIPAWRMWIAPLSVALALSSIIFGYYLTHKGIASKASTAATYPDLPINLPSSWKNVAFVLYEWLGFDGLGPPRNDMRIRPTMSTFAPYLGWIILGLSACTLLAVWFMRASPSPETRNAKSLLIASGISLLILFVAARSMHFGFVGRHAMSLIGVACCSMALMMLPCESKLSRIAFSVMLIAWTISSARLLFIYPYGKDDLRTAIQAARSTNLPILWNASVFDPDPGYYNAGDPVDLPSLWFVPPPVRSREHWRLATKIHRLELGPAEYVDEEARRLAPGAYVLVRGKPDLADPKGFWAHEFSEWHPRLLNRLNGYDVLFVDVPKHQIWGAAPPPREK
jgi:hypothetical protein